MQLTDLYRLKTDDIPKVIDTLTACFYGDPLYRSLIPSDPLRREILPDVFGCDANELLQYCDMYADSPEVRGLMILEDPSEHRDVRKLLAERYFAYRTEQLLAADDESGRVLENFRRGRDYLSSDWTQKLGADNIHIVYFAVRREFHGSGLAHRLMAPVLQYADESGMSVTLETHNPDNLKIYRHYGFDVFDTFTRGLDLREYCLVRRPSAAADGLTDAKNFVKS